MSVAMGKSTEKFYVLSEAQLKQLRMHSILVKRCGNNPELSEMIDAVLDGLSKYRGTDLYTT